jgi:hypothetical protein
MAILVAQRDAPGHLDLGHLDLDYLDLGHLDLGHLDSGHLDSGHLDLGYRARRLRCAQKRDHATIGWRGPNQPV